MTNAMNEEASANIRTATGAALTDDALHKLELLVQVCDELQLAVVELDVLGRRPFQPKTFPLLQFFKTLNFGARFDLLDGQKGLAPCVELFIFLFEVVQLLQALDLLLRQRVQALPRVVDVRPALPLDQILRFPFLVVGVEAFARVPVLLDGVHGRGSAGGYDSQRTQIPFTNRVSFALNGTLTQSENIFC